MTARRTQHGFQGQTLELTREEIETLSELCHFYERSMGPMRRLVVATASREVRAKYRFVADESRYLAAFLSNELQAQPASSSARLVSIQPRALVALWGRLLAAGRHKRTLRRLSPEQRTLRERLTEKFTAAARNCAARNRDAMETEIATRRTREAEWMRELVDQT